MLRLRRQAHQHAATGARAAASAALKEKLTALSPLATGLRIQGSVAGGSSPETLLRGDDRRRAAVRGLEHSLGLQPAVFTLETGMPLIVNSGQGSALIRPL